MASNPRKMKKAHEGMTLKEKENCNCDRCKLLNVDNRRKPKLIPNTQSSTS